MADVTQSTGTATLSGSSSTNARQDFLSRFEREHATTAKVLRAFPAAQLDFRPHDRSNSARQLAWTFVVEETMIANALKHQPVFGTGHAPVPETWSELLAAFDAQRDEVVSLLRNPSNPTLDGTVAFFVAPKQMGEYRLGEFLQFILCDQIHHRGQLSVYVRMAGGKVPSIYGPSADEPWM